TGDRRFGGDLGQFAAFGDATLKLSKLLSLSAGGRYFRYRRRAGETVLVANPITGPDSTLPFAARYRAEGSVGRVRGELRPATRLLTYVQVSSGFRPGGINVVPGLDPTLAVYRDDRLTSTEIGARIGLDRDRLQLNAALYRQNWSHMQYSALSVVGGYAFITNVGSARSAGAELGLRWTPSRIVQARIEATYTDARLASDQVNATAETAGRKGDSLPYVARFAVAGSISADWPIGNRLHLLVDGGINYLSRSSSTFRANDPDHLTMGDYLLADLSVGIARDGHRATIFASNLGNSRGRTWAASTVFGAGQLRQVRPRTIGISLTCTF
ncbi:MAG: TonB-dependent receptor, partial [Rhizorhabdus sp.]